MRIVRVVVAAWLLLLPVLASAMDEAVFTEMIEKIRAEEYPTVEAFLEANRAALAKDPEYTVLLLNYVGFKGRQQGVMVAQGEARPGELELRDPETGAPVGFVGERVVYDKELVGDGLRRAQKALGDFRERLDIHFGIVAIAEDADMTEFVGEQLVTVLKTSREIDNRWIWGPINAMEGEPKEFMIDNVLNRTYGLFYAGTPEADQALEAVSQALVDYYPELIYGYANLGSLNLARGNYPEALGYFNKALEIDPDDEVVVENLKLLKEKMK